VLAVDRDRANVAFESWSCKNAVAVALTPTTVRHRTIRSKGCLSNGTALAIVFKLVEGAQKSWRRLDGHNQLPKLVLGVTFADGIEVIAKPTDRQPTTGAA
jgi:putative transposase